MSGFDPRDLERQLGIDDESLREQYGPQVNIQPRQQEAPRVEQVVIPPTHQLPGTSQPKTSSRGSFWDMFGVSLSIKKDMAGPYRYTRAITYAIPFMFAALLMSPLLVPMTGIVWYLVLVAFGKHIHFKVYAALLALALIIGTLGLIALHLFPWLYGLVR